MVSNEDITINENRGQLVAKQTIYRQICTCLTYILSTNAGHETGRTLERERLTFSLERQQLSLISFYIFRGRPPAPPTNIENNPEMESPNKIVTPMNTF